MNAYMLTAQSSNQKTGSMPVSTSPMSTCPDCDLSEICYFKQSYMGSMWKKLSAAEPGDTFKNGRSNITTIAWSQLLTTVSHFTTDLVWRFNQAGDLPGEHNWIDAQALSDLVDANQGARGFTYTHKPVLGDSPIAQNNRAAIADATARGFTINLSGNGLGHADRLADLGIAPVVTLLPSNTPKHHHKITTPAGRTVIPCPKHYTDIQCKDCKLCAVTDRKVIIGFPGHGAKAKQSDAITAANA